MQRKPMAKRTRVRTTKSVNDIRELLDIHDAKIEALSEAKFAVFNAKHTMLRHCLDNGLNDYLDVDIAMLKRHYQVKG